MKIYQIIILLLIYILFSCEKDNSSVLGIVSFETGPPGSFSYLSYDSLGRPVVRGWLRFEFTDSKMITGSWRLKKLVDRNDLGPQFGEGELIGRIKNSSIWMELNPQYKDHNLHLSGTISETRIEGKWIWISFVGVTNWGTFKAIKN